MLLRRHYRREVVASLVVICWFVIRWFAGLNWSIWMIICLVLWICLFYQLQNGRMLAGSTMAIHFWLRKKVGDSVWLKLTDRSRIGVCKHFQAPGEVFLCEGKELSPISLLQERRNAIEQVSHLPFVADLSLSYVLSQVGWEVSILEGGYREYRKHVQETIETVASKLKVNVITGKRARFLSVFVTFRQYRKRENIFAPPLGSLWRTGGSWLMTRMNCVGDRFWRVSQS